MDRGATRVTGCYEADETEDVQGQGLVTVCPVTTAQAHNQSNDTIQKYSQMGKNWRFLVIWKTFRLLPIPLVADISYENCGQVQPPSTVQGRAAKTYSLNGSLQHSVAHLQPFSLIRKATSMLEEWCPCSDNGRCTVALNTLDYHQKNGHISERKRLQHFVAGSGVTLQITYKWKNHQQANLLPPLSKVLHSTHLDRRTT